MLCRIYSWKNKFILVEGLKRKYHKIYLKILIKIFDTINNLKEHQYDITDW